MNLIALVACSELFGTFVFLFYMVSQASCASSETYCFSGQLYVIGNILGHFQLGLRPIDQLYCQLAPLCLPLMKYVKLLLIVFAEFSRLREEVIEENEAFRNAGMVCIF
jgi:hypothetical protein